MRWRFGGGGRWRVFLGGEVGWRQERQKQTNVAEIFDVGGTAWTIGKGETKISGGGGGGGGVGGGRETRIAQLKLILQLIFCTWKELLG